jgi:hypothetical protein
MNCMGFLIVKFNFEDVLEFFDLVTVLATFSKIGLFFTLTHFFQWPTMGAATERSISATRAGSSMARSSERQSQIDLPLTRFSFAFLCHWVFKWSN